MCLSRDGLWQMPLVRSGVEGAWEGGVYEKFQLGEVEWEFLKKFEVWSTHANSPSYLNTLDRIDSTQFTSVDFLHLKDYELLQKSLSVVDIAYFGGTVDMISDHAQIAKNNSGIIVLTLGAHGSIAFEGDRSYTQEAIATDIVDTTGCGDAFQAAFTANYFTTKDIRTSLLVGANLGKKAAMSFGGIPWE